jgi:hypothetical protein
VTQLDLALAEIRSEAKIVTVRQIVQCIRRDSPGTGKMAQEVGLTREEFHHAGGQTLANLIHWAIEKGFIEEYAKELVGGGEETG